MTTSARAVTVATTAGGTRLDTDESTDKASSTICVYNAGAATVFLGGSGVTTAAGFPLAAGASMSVELVRPETLYGIVAADTVEVRVLEVGV